MGSRSSRPRSRASPGHRRLGHGQRGQQFFFLLGQAQEDFFVEEAQPVFVGRLAVEFEKFHGQRVATGGGMNALFSGRSVLVFEVGKPCLRGFQTQAFERKFRTVSRM